MRAIDRYSFRSRQRGAVLVVSMLLLLVMTILALGASQSTRMQERMAGSARNHDLALQSAEAGLRAGERFLADLALTSAPIACATSPCTVYEPGILTQTLSYRDQAFQSQPWWDANARNYAAAEEIGGAELADRDPQYYIEELEEVRDDLTPTSPSVMYYRVVSRAQGATDNAVVVLQSTFARRFN